MKAMVSMIALGMTAFVFTGCGCFDWCNPSCDPCPKQCAPRPCPEQRPHCQVSPHVWDDTCCDPSNYAY